MSASALLDALERSGVNSWSDVVRRVTALLDRPVRVDRRRRAATLALSVAIPLGIVLMGAVIDAMVMPAISRAIPPEIEELSHALDSCHAARQRRSPSTALRSKPTLRVDSDR